MNIVQKAFAFDSSSDLNREGDELALIYLVLPKTNMRTGKDLQLRELIEMPIDKLPVAVRLTYFPR